ncbi:MAG: hypothetical protein JWL70_317 [Acidimicrobiia bacterium]|nr:hypothetical protein [Acidimicrobiia bacterium]
MSEATLVHGNPDLESVGPITFGPGDVLFVADNRRAKILAIDVADPSTQAASGPLDVEQLDAKLAAYLGSTKAQVVIRDMAVHPRTGNVYLSVMRGTGDSEQPLLIRLDRATGSISEVVLESLAFGEYDIADAPEESDERLDVRLGEGDEVEYNGRKFLMSRIPARMSVVTDMAFVDGTLLVAGMSNEEFASNLRRIPFPFTGEVAATGLEIFHVSHGLWETASPIRTFVPYDNGASILASYTCTPLVHFPLADLAPGGQARGRTVAELGWGNQPLDIVSFRQGGSEHLLISHSFYPPTKIDSADINRQEPLTQPQEPVGVPRQESDLSGISLMANLDDQWILALQSDDQGRHLRSLKVDSL